MVPLPCKKPSFFLLVAAMQLCSSQACTGGNTTRRMLDSFARMADATVDGVDASFFDEFTACLSLASDDGNVDVAASSDAAWWGFDLYWKENGTVDDGWGDCTSASGCASYRELNMTALDVDSILVYEPCNSVSNTLYYRMAVGVCARESSWAMGDATRSALVQASVTMGWGSFFWHGSHTILGNIADNRLIDVIAFVAYQGAITPLLEGVSSENVTLLRDLSEVARSATAVNTTRALTAMFITAPVETWTASITALDMPSYFDTFSAIVCLVLTLALPESPDTVDEIVQILAQVLNLPVDDLAFVTDSYLPALREATASRASLSRLQRGGLMLKFTGVLIKILYAFVWQENFIEWERVYGDAANRLRAALMPSVNALANFLTGFAHTDPDVQSCAPGLYAGADRCRVESTAPHAKWHEMSANGLLDLMFMTDDIAALTGDSMTPDRYEIWGFSMPSISGWWTSVRQALLA